MPTLPTTLYRTTQVRTLEQLILQQDRISSFELMTRAGVAAFQCIQNKWAGVQSIAVFCGGGNNAGDGYVLATLALKAGLAVRVYSAVDPNQLQGDALIAYQAYVQAQGLITSFRTKRVISAELIVDALLGIGLNRAVSELYAVAIHAINQSNLPVIAIDTPSGLNADTGQVLGQAVKATCTVTFIALKQGLFTGSAAQHCGEIVYAPLTDNDAIFQQVDIEAKRVVHAALPKRDRCANKGHYGHVLVIGGDLGYMGAVRLAGEAALRVGAGLVSIATRPEHASLLSANCPELMCHGMSNIQQLKPLLDRAGVIVLGPGLGQSHWSRILFRAAIKTQKLMIIDADALNLLAVMTIDNFMTEIRFQKSFQTSFQALNKEYNPLATISPSKLNWILTPHPGEAARLLGCSTVEVQKDRFAAARTLCTKYYHSVAVLKGAGTLIASDQGVMVSNTGNPGMASGGMGDALSGVIAGLVAQGLPPIQAAQQGVYGHGLAADWAAEQGGERGLLASDLMPHLRRWVNL